MIDVSHWKLDELTRAWRDARPFPHVVIDELVTSPTLTLLAQSIAQEPHWPNRGEIYDFMGSGDTVSHPVLRQFHTALGAPAVLAAVRAISGHPVERADLRSYVYMAGSYLLPHSDCRTGLGRLVAYAFYVWIGGCEGGELELFDCVMDGDEVTAASPSLRIAPRENRLVLFDVTPRSLHQVREVLAGARISLTGWFLA